MSGTSNGDPNNYCEVSISEDGELIVKEDHPSETIIVETVATDETHGDLMNIINQNNIDNVTVVEADVPEVVASEMVITTTPGGHKRKQNIKTIRRISHDSSVLYDSETADWNYEVRGISDDGECGLNMSSYIAVMPQFDAFGMPVRNEGKTLQEITKRERDRIRKQELRKNPFVRERERDKARARMKLKRQEPGYRDVERERDRVRRQLARSNNPQQREHEREADKERKRLQRGLSVTVKDVLSVLPLSTDTCEYVMDISHTNPLSGTNCDSSTLSEDPSQPSGSDKYCSSVSHDTASYTLDLSNESTSSVRTCDSTNTADDVS